MVGLTVQDVKRVNSESIRIYFTNGTSYLMYIENEYDPMFGNILELKVKQS